MNKAKWILKCVLGGILFLLVLVTVTMLLWNWLIPSLFHGPQIRFVEAFGLLVLSKILFSGGWGRGPGRGHQFSWKHRYYDKLSSMSPEERERFKARLREKWRCGGSLADEGEARSSNV